MPETPLRVLLVEDDPMDARLVAHALRQAGYSPTQSLVDNETAFTAALLTGQDVVLCDWNLPQFDALRALEIVHAADPDVPFILVSGSIGEEAAAAAMKNGAADYVMKDRLGRLGQAVKQALVRRDLLASERQAREAIAASEARYRALADSIPQLVWQHRAGGHGHVEYVNRRVAEYTGVEPDGLSGWAWERFVHPNDLERMRPIRDQAPGGATALEFEVRLRRADGTYRWHIARQVAVHAADGTVAHWVGTCTDIHDQKTAMEQLARDAHILAGVRDSVVVTDLDGLVTYWNEGATRLFGWTAAEMLGQPYVSMADPASREPMARRIRACADGSEWHGEFEDRRKDGTRVWTGARYRRLDRPDGTPEGILVSSVDLTERRRLEDQFRQAQKMEAIGRLAGGIAHDFNNLLTVINGFSEMLLPRVPADSPDRNGLAAIRDAGERAAALTSQLLAFSRKAIIAPKVLDLTELIVQAEKLLRRLIGEDIVLTVIYPNVPCRIEADPGQIDQVVMNLAVNARDAMPTGGRLTLEIGRVTAPATRPAETGELRPGRYVQLTVSDTGCGMTDEVKSRLFEPFFTTKELGKGTGLGLAVVHGIVRQAGGHITFESSPGAGTTFRLYFPEVSDPTPARLSGTAAGSGRGSETVLLVEDDEAVRTLSQFALESQGYSVIPAGTGDEAIAAAARRDGPIHILVTDVVMPKLSGRAVADGVRAHRPDIRVLFVSGYTEDAIVRHGMRESSAAFLQKPFSPLGLARKVRSVLDSSD